MRQQLKGSASDDGRVVQWMPMPPLTPRIRTITDIVEESRLIGMRPPSQVLIIPQQRSMRPMKTNHVDRPLKQPLKPRAFPSGASIQTGPVMVAVLGCVKVQPNTMT